MANAQVTQTALREAIEANQGIRRDRLMALLDTNLDRFNAAKRVAIERRTLFIQKSAGWTIFYTMQYAIDNVIQERVYVEKTRTRAGVSQNTPEELEFLSHVKFIDSLWHIQPMASVCGRSF